MIKRPARCHVNFIALIQHMPGEVGDFPAEQTDIHLPSPLPFPAGTYWLELHEGTSTIDFDGAAIFWATSAFTRGRSLYDDGVCPECDVPSNARAREFAFELYDAPVPEPGTIGMAALGLGVVLWFRRWRG